MNSIKFVFLFCLLFSVNESFSQKTKAKNELNCKKLRNCDLLFYYTEDSTISIEMRDSVQIEHHYSTNSFIKYRIVWKSDCEFQATIIENTVPDFPYGPGQVMYVKFDSQKGKKIKATGTYSNKNFPLEYVLKGYK